MDDLEIGQIAQLNLLLHADLRPENPEQDAKQILDDLDRSTPGYFHKATSVRVQQSGTKWILHVRVKRNRVEGIPQQS
jgi:hypothetical protein